VRGRITYRGKAVASGQISFLPPSGVPVCAEIASDGTYHAHGVPRGQVIVTVTSLPPRYADPAERLKVERARWKGAPPERLPASHETVSAKSPSLLPQKYARTDTSTLRCVVDQAECTFDVDLK
jgi:hypothetical protein